MDRSTLMSRVRSKDTKPELIVRRILWKQGYRYRLHVKSLPGTPDIAFRSRKIAIFVHGCFWHGHEGCRMGRLPKSNVEFWTSKVRRNQARDYEARATLERMGWSVLVIWECEVKQPDMLTAKVLEFMSNHLPQPPTRSAKS